MPDTQKKKPFKLGAADALRELNNIISKVDKECPSQSRIIPEFLLGTFQKIHFQCTIEYGYRDIHSQLEALEKLSALMEHISNNEDRWVLPYGKTTRRKWHTHSFPAHGDAPSQRSAHLEIIEDDIMRASLSSHGNEGGVTFRLPVVDVQPEGKARVGVLVARLGSTSTKFS